MGNSYQVLREELITITTLGNFDIRYKDKSLLKSLGRSYKILDLLKYFISFKGKKLLPENIISNLSDDTEYQDPKNVLRTQIFRLRKILKKIESEIGIGDYIFDISLCNGYYIFQTSENCVVDSELFEEKISQGNRLLSVDSIKAAEAYKDAIFLYKGDYLGKASYNDWIIPIRNRYNRIYLQTTIKLMELLKSDEKYNSIIELCESIQMIEPLDEALNIHYMESLLKTGQVKQAMSYYEYITHKLYKDLGIKPSTAMKNIYRKIQIENEEKIESDLFFIEKRLMNDEGAGALFCDIDYFKFIYNLERRKSKRKDILSYVGLITIIKIDNKKHFDNELKDIMLSIKEILLKSLRKGDVFSFWNDSQIVVILSEIEQCNIDIVEKRIQREFENALLGKEYNLKFKFRRIIANE